MSVHYLIVEAGITAGEDRMACDGCGHGVYRGDAKLVMNKLFGPWRYCPKCGQAIMSFESHGED